MSLVNSVLGNTVGLLWSGATGTVDPWTKANLIEDETNNLVQASGGSLSPSDAAIQANSDISGSLTIAGADPSQASTGLFSSANTVESYLKIALIAGVIFVGAMIYLETRPRG